MLRQYIVLLHGICLDGRKSFKPSFLDKNILILDIFFQYIQL